MTSVRRRARKRHQQLSMLDATGTKKADPRVGKARGGRPRKRPRGCPPHKKRETFTKNEPVHVTIRVRESVGSLRRRFLYAVLRAATVVMAANHAARIIHMSIQKNHIHLIVEAGGAEELSRAMQALQISAAKGINRVITRRVGQKRRGQVFENRFHVEVIRSPRQARSALAYVLNNWRKHRVHRDEAVRGWRVDPWSTAWMFDGWKEDITRERERVLGAGVDALLHVVEPRTWLLRTGWRRHGLVGIYETPSMGAFVRRMAARDERRWRETMRELAETR